jgi:hypothetical protein
MSARTDRICMLKLSFNLFGGPDDASFVIVFY